jgi:glycerate dehydrogenase
MKAVFLDFATMGTGLDLKELESLVSELVIHEDSPDDAIAARIADADIVFTNKIRLTRGLLENAPKLKLIALTATGTDNIDTNCAREHGIAVANIRHYCTQSVVEHVFGVLLSLTHSLGQYQRSVRAGDWQRSSDFCMLHHPVRELSSMTLGKADVISLHCPLTDATRNLFGKPEFKAMKRSAILVNTARGGLVDSRALVDALAKGEIAAAAVDVLPDEPPVDGDPLLDYRGDNLIVTPHIAWATDEARQNAIDELAANTRAFLEGIERNRVV